MTNVYAMRKIHYTSEAFAISNSEKILIEKEAFQMNCIEI